MKLISSGLRSLVATTLATGLALTVACAQEDPFADLREGESSTGESEGESDSEGDESDGKDSDGTKGTGTGGSQQTEETTKTSGDATGSTPVDGSSTTGTDNTDDSTGDTTSTGGDTTSTDDTTSTTDETNPLCQRIPKKLVVLGDFTPAGRDPIEGPDDPKNGFKMLYEHMKGSMGMSDLQYQNLAVATSIFVEIEQNQLAGIASSDEPLLVVIHSGSNDLAEFATSPDSEAEEAFVPKWNESKASLDKIVAHFRDSAKFPKGVEIVLDNLYSPFDDCSEPVLKLLPSFMSHPNSPKKTELFSRFNGNIESYAADNGLHINDLHDAFLGHGFNRDNDKCPHHDRAGAMWMKGGDLNALSVAADNTIITDINVDGHASVGTTLSALVDKLYGGC